MKILVVDDDMVSRQLMHRILVPFAECEVAEDGEEALQYFKKAQEEKKPFDLIFLDIMMPKMDGRETLRQIREWENSKNIPPGDGAKIVMVTALGDPKNILSSFKEGCEHYIVKPINKAELINLLETINLKPTS